MPFPVMMTSQSFHCSEKGRKIKGKMRINKRSLMLFSLKCNNAYFNNYCNT